ncbi:flavin reductase [Aeromicrobium sp. YIM 150415]|uniref:flavin reductase family protein n=1 Tax=Aeromicrobium sp. YIM 150415 TaxID=2803912 RepID=UPI001962EA32|nr:flavin reductase family protein [Aeromicrobium sp. YIM 150415]MBM9462640.1 flavin reductase [Aeromicrobium sp. YIM 150415]
MTIHTEHPFVPPEPERDALRRFRGRLAAPVTVVAAGEGRRRSGLTVSSLLIADGEPPHVVILVDPDSDLRDRIEVGTPVAISLLDDGDQFLADAFAGTAPAPGGPFTLGSWTETPWGPAHDGRSWIGARLASISSLGYSDQIVASVEHIIIEGTTALSHVRGRYRPV